MNIIENIRKIFDENGINYFSGSRGNENLITVPYRGIINPKNRIDIYLEVDEFLKIIKYSFSNKINKSREIAEIKSQILDINANLQVGSLSMRNESEFIEYRIDDIVIENEFSFKQYNINIVSCVKVYEMLKENGLII